MVQLTDQQRAFVVKTYPETKSYVATLQAFWAKFRNHEPPTKKAIQQNVLKYEIHGTSQN